MMGSKMSTEEREILEKFERGELRTASDVEHELVQSPSSGSQYVQQDPGELTCG